MKLVYENIYLDLKLIFFVYHCIIIPLKNYNDFEC